MATALLHEEFIDDETAALREAFNADFWEQAGWDASLRLVRPPADHPLLGYSCCVIPGCEQRAIKHGGICPVCRRRQEKTSLTVEQFIADAQLEPAVAGSRRRLFDATCLVEDCPRPQQVQSVRLCNTHHSLCGDRFGATTADTVDQFLRQTDVVPLTPLGPCRVLACTRLASTVRGLCQSHHGRWKAAHARKDFDFEHWLKTDSGLKRIGVVNLRAIPELVMWEFMIAVAALRELGSQSCVRRLGCAGSARPQHRGCVYSRARPGRHSARRGHSVTATAAA